MFKMGLLTSTAMTTAVLLLSPTLRASAAQTDMRTAPSDANARFLCTYGHFLVSDYFVSGNGFLSAYSTTVAVPVKGHGQTVRRIKVVETTKSSHNADAGFFVGIYSNTSSGLPGNRITGGFGKQALNHCGPITISISPPAKLKRRTTYWIEESCVGSSAGCSFSWEADPYTKRKAYVRTFKYFWSSSCSCGSGSSYLSPWTKQTAGPYLKLK